MNLRSSDETYKSAAAAAAQSRQNTIYTLQYLRSNHITPIRVNDLTIDCSRNLQVEFRHTLE